MSYGIPLKNFKRYIEKYHKTWPEILSALNMGNDEDGKSTGRSIVAMYRHLYELHIATKYYFQDSDLINFLRETRIPDMNSAKKAIESFIENSDIVSTTNWEDPHDGSKPPILGVTFVLLSPEGKTWTILLVDFGPKNYVIFYSVVEDKSVEDRFIRTGYNWDSTEKFEDKFCSNGFDGNLAMILNFIYYIQAFPDAIVEGKPEGNGKINKAFSKCRVLQTHPSIVETSHETTARVTHFRKGHFRVLKAARYKEPGKVIFVHSCIVKGTPAKTVI